LPVASALARIITSVEPPGGQGQIRVTGFVGKSAAAAAVASATSASGTYAQRTRRRIAPSF
jgi:hypothetical protein